jgi:hypothetical protein
VYSLGGRERHNLLARCNFHSVLGRSRGRLQTVFPGAAPCICSESTEDGLLGNRLLLLQTTSRRTPGGQRYFRTSTTSSTCFGAGRRQRRPYFWPLFRPGFWGWALGWGREKGNCLSWTRLQSFFQHPSQPFTLGFQILILTPELLHLFGNIFPCHTPDSPASSLGKANFVQPVSRRQTITTNAGAATHGIDNDGSACRDSYQSASSTRL